MTERTAPRAVVGVDTTGDLGSVAALVGEEPIVRSFAPGRQHSANLLPALEDVLEAAGADLGPRTLLAAARGPGSFTGLRVGLATIQGLALANGLEAVGVSALDAAAAMAPAADGPVLVLVDALRGELFGGVYPRGPGPMRLRPEETGGVVRECGAVAVAGPGVARWRDALRAANPGIPVHDEVPPLAAAVARIGRDRFVRGEPAPLAPLYLRAPDAVPSPPAGRAPRRT